MKYEFSNFINLELLQSGGWGKVYSCYNNKLKIKIALKFFGYTNKIPSINSINNEIKMMKRTKNIEGIIKLIDIFEDTLKGYLNNKNPLCMKVKYPIIIMELLYIDIFTFISTTNNKISEKYLAKLFKSIIITLNELHSNHLIHRDLKLENIMLESNSIDSLAKIIDLGEMVELKPGETEYKMKTRPPGSLGYFAPETVLHNINSSASDIFQAGCILYAMLSGTSAFRSNLLHSVNGNYNPMTGEAWESISDEAKNLVDLLLKKDPKERLTGQQILEHPWLSGTANDNQLSNAYITRIHHLILRQKMKKFFLSSDILHDQKLLQDNIHEILLPNLEFTPKTPRNSLSSTIFKSKDSFESSESLENIHNNNNTNDNNENINKQTENEEQRRESILEDDNINKTNDNTIITINTTTTTTTTTTTPINTPKNKDQDIYQSNIHPSSNSFLLFEELHRKSFIKKLNDLKKKIINSFSSIFNNNNNNNNNNESSVNNISKQHNPRKSVNYQEFCQMMSECDLFELSEERVFRIFDIRNSGLICMKDFLLTLMTIVDSTTNTTENNQEYNETDIHIQNPAHIYFSLFDLNGNGTIDKNELQTILYLLLDDISANPTEDNLDVITPADIDDLFQTIGKDGQITFDDFQLFYEAVISSTRGTTLGLKSALSTITSRKDPNHGNNSNNNTQLLPPSSPIPLYELFEEKQETNNNNNNNDNGEVEIRIEEPKKTKRKRKSNEMIALEVNNVDVNEERVTRSGKKVARK